MMVDAIGKCGSTDAGSAACTVLSAADDHRFWSARMSKDENEDDDEDGKLVVKKYEEEAKEMEIHEEESMVKIKNSPTDSNCHIRSAPNLNIDNQAPDRHKASHRNTPGDLLQPQAETGAGSKAPASPERDEELEQIVTFIDQKHCDKYKWYIERHLRTIFVPRAQPSRQLFYRRVMQAYFTKENHTTQQIPGSAQNKERYEVMKMRPSAFPRIDYEATLAQYTARQTSGSLAWATSKKRVPADKLGAVLHQAVEAYGWPEVVTDANVDETLRRDGIRDLDAFGKHQEETAAALPVANSFPIKKEHEFSLRNMIADGRAAHQHQPQLRQSTIFQQTSRVGLIAGSNQDHHSTLTPHLPETTSQYDTEEKPRVNNTLPQDKKERRERKMRLRRQQEQKRARLEELRQKFERDMEHLFAEYSRRRSEIEAQFSSMVASAE
ncbi:hypothetical protein F5Y13DRAFT_76345 [Hypoxylon sp. FL1857]|nr:hypothetical protein F5Y13DRAFT_76345 [Hypoxylon sp. FL1857]